MTAVARQLISAQEYLELERNSLDKHEYYAGQIYAMAGGTYQHSQISTNVIREVGNRLKGKPCDAHGSDLRVLVNTTGLYTYPDCLVICGKPEFHDDKLDTVTNPTVLIEVLSDSTEKYDRGDKFRHYRKIPSLKQFVKIAQHKAHVEVYSRMENDWKLTEIDGLDSNMALESLQIEVPLSEIYDRVSLDSNGDVLHE